MQMLDWVGLVDWVGRGIRFYHSEALLQPPLGCIVSCCFLCGSVHLESRRDTTSMLSNTII
jgi:hypothetical protein